MMGIKSLILLILGFVNFQLMAQLSNPPSQLVCPGEEAVFVVKGLEEGMQLQWQLQNGSMYVDVNGETSDTFKVQTTLEQAGETKAYRCKASINSKNFFTEVFTLEIATIPVPSFSYTTPCDNQEVNFVGSATSIVDISDWRWYFTESDSSVYQNPDYFYGAAGDYLVKLKVIDINGCVGSVESTVKVYPSPEIIFDEDENELVLCSNEIETYFLSGLKEDESVVAWKLKSDDGEIYGNKIDSTGTTITIDWDVVDDPVMVTISSDVISSNGCTASAEYDVLITNYEAPEKGEVFRKPYESSLLIYRVLSEDQRIETLKLQWGYTNEQGNDVLVINDDGQQNFYHDFDVLDEGNSYWVETSYGSQIKCKTRNFLNQNKSTEINNQSNQQYLNIDTNLKDEGLCKVEVYDLYSNLVFEKVINLNNGILNIDKSRLLVGYICVRISSSKGTFIGEVKVFN